MTFIINQKLIIIICDNGGHMVINRLQLAKGGKEYICNLRAARATNLKFVDFENHAKSMGANAETVSSTSELEAAFKRAKESDKTYNIKERIAFEKDMIVGGAYNTFELKEGEDSSPQAIKLLAAYPNPFNPVTSIT